MKKFLLPIITLFFFYGCELESPFKPSKDELALQEKQIDAKIAQDKEKLLINKELELAKIQSEVEKEKIISTNKKDDNNFKLSTLKSQQEIEIQKYYILLLAVVIIIATIGLYIYFNNRRKDKLRAYEDNLEKYFRAKENEAKLQITNKVLDLISSGKLSDAQETKLIKAINEGTKKASKKLAKIEQNEEIYDLEIIEDSKESKKTKKD